MITARDLREQWIGTIWAIYGPDGSGEADHIVLTSAVDNWLDDGEKAGRADPILDYVDSYLANEGPWCNVCGCSCETHIVDNGVGRTEFQGAVSNHVQYSVESICCDGIPYEDPLLTIELSGGDDE